MKIIKFRVWHLKRKKLLEVHNLEGTGQKILFVTTADDERFCIDVDVGQMMQFTGLRDKYGKEIYEGDIIYISYEGEEYEDVGRATKEVKWDEKGFGWHPFNDSRYQITNELEVIGNIYENPELLR